MTDIDPNRMYLIAWVTKINRVAYLVDADVVYIPIADSFDAWQSAHWIAQDRWQMAYRKVPGSHESRAFPVTGNKVADRNIQYTTPNVRSGPELIAAMPVWKGNA